MRDIRLGYLCADPGIPPDGTKGASVHFREMGRALSRNGFDLAGVSHRSPLPGWVEFPLRSPASTRAKVSGTLARELEVLTHQTPIVEALESYGPLDALYERYSLFGLAGLRYASASGVPFLLEVNAPLWEEALAFRSLALEASAKAVAQELFRRATLVLVVSDGLRRRVIEEGADPERVVVFPNGVAPSFLVDAAPAPRPESFGHRRILTFVGSLKPWHGIEMLLEAVMGLPDEFPLSLWVVGDGPEAHRVDALAAEFPHRIHRTPAVAHEEVPAILRASDLTVAPYTPASPTYFCPLKVIEAFAVGVPLLASDVEAVQGLDLRGLDYTGFTPGSAQDFREVLGRTLADLPAAKSRARQNRDVAQRRFTWDRRAIELGEFIGEPIARAGAA